MDVIPTPPPHARPLCATRQGCGSPHTGEGLVLLVVPRPCRKTPAEPSALASCRAARCWGGGPTHNKKGGGLGFW